MDFEYVGSGYVVVSGSHEVLPSFYYYEADVSDVFVLFFGGSADIKFEGFFTPICERDTANIGFRCRDPFGNIQCFAPQRYFPNCRNINIGGRDRFTKCDPTASAVVAGIIACRQRFIVPIGQRDFRISAGSAERYDRIGGGGLLRVNNITL